MTKPRALSRKAFLYLKHLSNDWGYVAKKLYFGVRRENSVWHLWGHAWEVLERPRVHEDLIDVFHSVANHPDVWYATNGELFLNELFRNNVQITETFQENCSVFTVQTRPVVATFRRQTAIPLRYSIPQEWKERFRLEVKTATSGEYEVSDSPDNGWINVYDTGAQIEIRRD